jgi:NAD(P)-dependent dehydrogenase (short-subunit alcohol dehydrogenase family)
VFVFANAGVSSGHSDLITPTPQDWEFVLGVNLMGVIWMMKTFVPKLVAQGPGVESVILSTSSQLGPFPNANGPYTVSKHAVSAAVETLSLDLARDEVRHVRPHVLRPHVLHPCSGGS